MTRISLALSGLLLATISTWLSAEPRQEPPSTPGTCDLVGTEVSGGMSYICKSNDCGPGCEAGHHTEGQLSGDFCFCDYGNQAVCCSLVAPPNNALPFVAGFCGVFGCPSGSECSLEFATIPDPLGPRTKVYWAECN